MPYSVNLLDDSKRAHPDVFNILLHVFEDAGPRTGREERYDLFVIPLDQIPSSSPMIKSAISGFSTANDEAENYNRMKARIMNSSSILPARVY